MLAGRHTKEFTGQHIASGVYFYRLEVDEGKEYLMTKKMVPLVPSLARRGNRGVKNKKPP